MKFTVLTLFPEIILAYFENSIMKRAVSRGLIEYEIVQIRDFASPPAYNCDDAPYGGGPGMIFKPEPLAKAIEAAGGKETFLVYPNPAGSPFSQEWAEVLSQLGDSPDWNCVLCPSTVKHLQNKKPGALEKKKIIFLCGRYEGIDQRIIDEYVDQELTIGDYILSSGELACLTIIDAVYRLCSGVINRESLETESLSRSLLEYPQYTRPREFHGRPVPEEILSGNHREIHKWRSQQSVLRTLRRRPDLLKKAVLNSEEQVFLEKLRENTET